MEKESDVKTIALTGASRPSLPTGESNGSASDLALRFLSPAGRDALRDCGGSEGTCSSPDDTPCGEVMVVALTDNSPPLPNVEKFDTKNLPLSNRPGNVTALCLV